MTDCSTPLTPDQSLPEEVYHLVQQKTARGQSGRPYTFFYHTEAQVYLVPKVQFRATFREQYQTLLLRGPCSVTHMKRKSVYSPHQIHLRSNYRDRHPWPPLEHWDVTYRALEQRFCVSYTPQQGLYTTLLLSGHYWLDLSILYLDQVLPEVLARLVYDYQSL